MSAMRERAGDWLADHLAAIVIIMLALWAPPLVFSVLVDLKIVDGAGAGYPALRDPGLLLGLWQIALMALSLPSLRYRQARGWQLLAGACGVWAVQAAWTFQWRLRLLGLRDLVSKESLITIGALCVAALVLMEVRGRFSRARPVPARRAGDAQRGLPQPDRT